MEKVVLIDFDDQVLGEMEKQQAHVEGKLHRAFSVILYHEDKMLIHKRASEKYHCGGLWTNSCCSHPRIHESYDDAVKRRLMEELGVVCDTKEIFSFVYYYQFSNGLTEFELDHVYIGEYDGEVSFDSSEIEEVKWISFEELKKDIVCNPTKYTPWFVVALKRVLKEIAHA
jgi:isopentenyl-diphosphate delta-isomerase